MTNERSSASSTKPKLNFRFVLSGAWIGGFVFCIIFAIATVFLGNWQMDRRMDKVAEINTIVDNYDLEPVSYADASHVFTDFDEEQKWTPIKVRGEYLDEDTLVARNRPRAGRPGFEVLVPFETDSGDRLLVDRGWLPLGADASAPDAVPAPPEGQTELIIRAIPGEVSVDRGAPEGQVASINLASIREELGYDIADEAYGLMAAESPAPADAPQQMPEPQRDEGPHLSYSMQWFTFGLMSFVVWGWLAYQKAVRNREDELYGEREEDGFISAHRVERVKPVKRRKGQMTDEEIEDAMLNG
ncbi:MAG TPA: SURF1 family protein [Candidatus Yaniella excrementavium]|nr:SURF1 family protein [Candidatus Yaniella excrementavium]